jgi:methyl-accepting chemotaxis protein
VTSQPAQLDFYWVQFFFRDAMTLQNFSIKSRILAGFTLPVVLFIGFTLWFTGQLTQVKQSLTQVSDQSVEYALLATAVDKNVVQIQQFLSDVSATQAKDGLDDGFKNAQANFDELNAGLAKFEKHFADMGDKASGQLIVSIQADAASYFATGNAMAKAFVAGGPAAGNKLMGGFDAASEKLQKELEPFVKSQVAQMKADLANASVKSDQIAQTGLTIVVVAIILALLVAWRVTASIIGPLANALGVARAVASGQLDAKIQADDTEIGQLLAPLATMQGTLQQFEKLQKEMAHQHELGMLDYVMPVDSLQGSYRSMGESINHLVSSIINVKLKVIDVVTDYSEGRLDIPMDRLPGQKARISEAMDKVQKSLSAAVTAAAFNVRILNALDKCSTNVMIADASNTIIYMNETVTAMLQRNESELRKVLPQFDASHLIGQSIDIFHKNPAHQRDMLASLRGTFRTQIQVGRLYFSLTANPIIDEAGQRVGTVVEWSDRTVEVGVESEVASVVQAAAHGDLSQRLTTRDKTGFFANLAGGINQLLQTSEQGLSDVARALEAVSQGDLTQRITADYEGLFGKVKDCVNTSSENLTRVIGEVRGAADALTGAANQVSATAQSLSQAASEQGVAVENGI